MSTGSKKGFENIIDLTFDGTRHFKRIIRI